MDDSTEQFTRLYREHVAAVVGYVRRLVDEPVVADVVSETFLVLWRRVGDAPEPVLPWLLGVARKLASNQRRGDRRRDRLQDLEGLRAMGRSAPDPADGVVERDRVLRALSELSPKDQEVLTLVGWDELDVREAATVLGVSRGTAAVRLHRARRRLEAALGRLAEASAPKWAGAPGV